MIKNLVNGKGSIVNIVGKAGIGKSRLMAEMKVQSVMDKVQMLEGRALSNGKNLSFHPIIHLIRSWAGHSLAEWLAGCREGRTDPDTLLERERTAEERAREALAAALHRDFLLRAPAWEHERFLEAYRRNFPLMR